MWIQIGQQTLPYTIQALTPINFHCGMQKKSNNNERFDEFYFYFSDNSRFFGYHKNEIISKYARFGMLLLPFFRFHLLDFVFSSFLIYHKRNGQALFIFTSVILAFSSFLSNMFFYTQFQAIVYKYGIMLK